MIGPWITHDEINKAVEAFLNFVEAVRQPHGQPYWHLMHGHHGKNSTRWGRTPAKPIKKSAAARKLYRGVPR